MIGDRHSVTRQSGGQRWCFRGFATYLKTILKTAAIFKTFLYFQYCKNKALLKEIIAIS